MSSDHRSGSARELDGEDPDDVISEVRRTGEGAKLYVAHHDVSEDGLSVTLSLALAAAADTSPTEFLPEFQEYVDPDALDRMFRPQANGDLRKGGPFQLSIHGLDVEIHNTGRIEIRD